MFDESQPNNPVEFIISRAGRPTHFIDDGKSDGFGLDDPLKPQAGTDLKDIVRDAFDLSLDREGRIYFEFNKAIIGVNNNWDLNIATSNQQLTHDEYFKLQENLNKLSQELREEEENN